MRGFWHIQVLTRDGKPRIDYRGQNMIHDLGKQLFLNCLFENAIARPTIYHIGLDRRVTPNKADTIINAASYEQPVQVATGYVLRGELDPDTAGRWEVALNGTTSIYEATSLLASGTWSNAPADMQANRNVFLVANGVETPADVTGVLVSTMAFEAPITVLTGETFKAQYILDFEGTT